MALSPLSTKTLLFVAIFATSGCHALKPSELWKLNRYPAPSHDKYFSVTDPIPEYDDEMADSGAPGLTAERDK